MSVLKVSIHAPAKEATNLLWRGPPVPWFQSTPPRRRRPAALRFPGPRLAVSIHAPAKEATPATNTPTRNGCVSIHAPAKEATSAAMTAECTVDGFNPRPREGGDPRQPCGRVQYKRFQSTPPRRRRLLQYRGSV